jgi:hypothetical protein
MEGFLVIAAIVLAIWLLNKPWRSRRPSRPNLSPQERSTTTATPQAKNTYRPARPAGSSSIKFGEIGSGSTAAPRDLKGLHDAFTGEALNEKRGLYQCGACKVFYHTESFDLIRAENGSRCVACQAAAIHPVGAQARPTDGRDYTPSLVTLGNFRSHFGQVVTFEGRVVEVRTSRRGSDFAVMFERKKWAEGFKLVFFRGSIRNSGGPQFILGMKGRTIRVRGLLINHNRWGPEIIINDRSMILSVR